MGKHIPTHREISKNMIDAHLHFFLRGEAEAEARAAGGLSTAEYLGQTLADNGIDFAVAMGTGETPGVPEAHPNLFHCLGIHGNDLAPERMKELLPRIETALRAPRCVGMKFYCGYDYFYPSDPRFAPLYELAGACGKPVVFHSGDTAGSRGKVKYSHPLEIDEVAVDFPQTRFVIAHCGNPWIADAVEVASKNANVALDLSGLAVGSFDPDELFRRYESYWRHLAMWIDYLSDDSRILYGSDWPLVNMRDYIALMRRVVPERAHEGFFDGNARRVFSLPKP